MAAYSTRGLSDDEIGWLRTLEASLADDDRVVACRRDDWKLHAAWILPRERFLKYILRLLHNGATINELPSMGLGREYVAAYLDTLYGGLALSRKIGSTEVRGAILGFLKPRFGGPVTATLVMGTVLPEDLQHMALHHGRVQALDIRGTDRFDLDYGYDLDPVAQVLHEVMETHEFPSLTTYSNVWMADLFEVDSSRWPCRERIVSFTYHEGYYTPPDPPRPVDLRVFPNLRHLDILMDGDRNPVVAMETLGALQSAVFRMVWITDFCEFLGFRNTSVKDVTVYLDMVDRTGRLEPGGYPVTMEGIELYIKNVQFPSWERVHVILDHSSGTYFLEHGGI